VAKTFIESIILVIVVIFLFLQNLRAALVPILVIPSSLIGTFGGMYLLGFSVNLLSLFGMVLAIGLVVDDAIVVIENVERIMSEEGLSPFKAALQAMREVSEPIVAIALVMAVIFVPVGFLGGLTGQLYRQFAITIAVSMGLSAFMALTLSPMLCSLIIKPREKKPLAPFRWFNAGFDKVRDGYLKGVAFFTRHAVIGVLVFVGFCVATLYLFHILPSGLVPAEDEGYLIVSTNLPAGASLTNTDSYNQTLVKTLLKQNPIANITSFAGFDILAQAEVSNSGVAFVVLKNYDQRNVKAQNFANKITQIGSQTPGGTAAAFNPPPITGLSTTGGLTGYLQATSGQNPKQLQQAANTFVTAAKKQPAIAKIQTTIDTNKPVYKADINRDKARSLGITIGAITQAMASTFGTNFVNRFTFLNRSFQVNMQSAAPFRQTPDDLSKIYVRATKGSAAGTLVPLSSVVTMHRAQAPDLVTRFNLFPAAKFLAQPASGYTSGQALQALEQALHKNLPQSYQLGWTGSAFQQQQIGSSSMFAYGFGVIMVFLILAAQYERWSLPLAVVTAVPFALFGAAAANLLRGLSSDVYFQIGLLVLIGLAAKNAILIVEYAVDLRAEGESVYDAAMHASRLRFRPIIMTSIAFIAGTLPLALASGASSASRHAIGTAVVGGMIGATVLAIFFVPLFYVLIERSANWLRRKRNNNVDKGENEHEA
jgi:multidrug efflux pump